MIRNVEDVTGLLNRRFGGAAGRPLSIARTLVWVIVALYVLGMLFPAKKVNINSTYYNRLVGTSAVRDQMLDKNDPRGFATPTKDPSTFTIAWIGTSTLQNVGTPDPKVPYSFVPNDVRKLVPTIAGKPVRVQMYVLESGRMMDMYNVLSHAIASKPDLIMLDLNPFWTFNDRATEEWGNLRGAVFADMVGQPDSWPYLAAYDSPSDLALALGSAHLSILRDRWSYAGTLREKIDKLSPLNPPKVSGPVKRPSGTAGIAAMQNALEFWNTFRSLVPKGSSVSELQQQMLISEKPGDAVINSGILDSMFSDIVSSKIPSVVYTSAIDMAALTAPGAEEALTRIENETAKIASHYEGKTLLVKPQAASRTVTGLTFKDMAHMTYDAPMAEYLANLVCTQVHVAKPTADCKPAPIPSKP